MGRAKAYLGVGSNLEPEGNTCALLELLSREPAITLTAISTFYRTPALPRDAQCGRDDPSFLNGVVAVETLLNREELSRMLARLETALGRRREADRFAPRTMDIDILLYFPARGPAAPPHPDVLTRSFVALPLLELEPELRLPPHRTSLKEIAARFPAVGGLPEPELTTALRERFLNR